MSVEPVVGSRGELAALLRAALEAHLPEAAATLPYEELEHAALKAYDKLGDGERLGWIAQCASLIAQSELANVAASNGDAAASRRYLEAARALFELARRLQRA